MNRSKRQRRVIAIASLLAGAGLVALSYDFVATRLRIGKLEAYGALIQLDESRPEWLMPGALREPRMLHQPSSVTIRNPNSAPDQLRLIAGLDSVRAIRVEGAVVDSSFVDALVQCKSVEYIWLDDCDFVDDIHWNTQPSNRSIGVICCPCGDNAKQFVAALRDRGNIAKLFDCTPNGAALSLESLNSSD